MSVRVREWRRWVALAAALAALGSLAACASPNTADADDAASVAAGADGRSIYLSIGDSYAAGFQPEPIGSTHGFAQQIAERSLSGPDPLTLYNLGCPGATAKAVLADRGCETAGSVVDGYPYEDTPQLAAALEVLRTHAGQVRLVTVSLGGNDIMECHGAADPVACSTDLMPRIAHNLDLVLTQLRQAAGPDVRIVGITYPDVYLKGIDSADPTVRAGAEASVKVFRDVLNPALAASYARVGAGFVDVTAQSGAYVPVDEVVAISEDLTVPMAVALMCKYTHYCDSQDVHPTTEGYSFIADKVLALVPEQAHEGTPS